MSSIRQQIEETSEPEAGLVARAYVHPGQLFFTSEDAVIVTILGSCVAVCLYHRDGRAGGMNHFLLPSGHGPASPRFADTANRLLLDRFSALGLPRRDLRAKVFGGAAMGLIKSDLAERNIAAAFDFLRGAGITVEASDVGGDRGRKLHFRTTDGAAWLRLL